MTPYRRATGPEAMVAALGRLPPRIARAMERVPRDRFLPIAYRHLAYEDEPVPLDAPESTISAPHMVAIQLEVADLGPDQNVLEVGSGSGYLLALIAELTRPGGRAVGLELEPGLVDRSRVTLEALGYAAMTTVRLSDGSAGAPDLAPFDRILVSCATREILPAWREQLATGGRIVAPVGGPYSQTLLSVGRDPNEPPVLGPECRFVALRSERPRPPADI
jgi:protein-L-isoaspartate(D-aspartate) O-methyltransferase